MAENKQPSTKEKLAAIVNGFDDFDSEMKIGTRVCHLLQFDIVKPIVSLHLFIYSLQRSKPECHSPLWNLPIFIDEISSEFNRYHSGAQQRREQDEFKIADLKSTMTRLDSELVVEIKRRTEMNKSTQMVIVASFLLETPSIRCLLEMMYWIYEYQSIPHAAGSKNVMKSDNGRKQIMY